MRFFYSKNSHSHSSSASNFLGKAFPNKKLWFSKHNDKTTQIPLLVDFFTKKWKKFKKIQNASYSAFWSPFLLKLVCRLLGSCWSNVCKTLFMSIISLIKIDTTARLLSPRYWYLRMVTRSHIKWRATIFLNSNSDSRVKTTLEMCLQVS